MNHYTIETGNLQVRSADERILTGTVMKWGETIPIGAGYERFRRGAFSGTAADDVVLLYGHDQRDPIGRGISLEDTPEGAVMEFRIANTPRGDDVLNLIRDGVLRSLSVGFDPDKYETRTHKGRRVIEHAKVRLREVSAVLWPAYPSAAVTATRESESNMDTEHIEAMEAANMQTREAVTELETRTNESLENLANALAELRDRAPEPVAHDDGPAVDPLDWFMGEVRALNGDMSTRALADITGTLDLTGNTNTDASGLVAEEFVGSQLVHVLNMMRPTFARAGSFPAVASGYSRYPVVTQSTTVAEHGTQKAEAASQALIVQQRTAEAKWWAGAVDVSLEIIATAEPSVLSVLWDDMQAQYAAATESDIITQAVAAATATGALLRTDTYENFITDLATEARAIRKATRAGGDVYFGLTEASWLAALTLMDGNGRRHFATRNPGDADGAATITAESMVLDGGIEIFVHEALTDFGFNQASLRAHDYGPSRLEAPNVPAIGRDVAIYGRTIVVPRIPTGIRKFAL